MKNFSTTGNGRNRISVSYIGNLEYTVPNDVFLVISDEDYVRLCHELSNRWRSETDLEVWVRSRNHFTWLQNFTEQTGCPSIFEEKTPRLLLAKKWNVQIPDWLSDADVLGNHLLEIDIDSLKPTTFTNRLLSHFLGNTFQLDILDDTQIVEVIKKLVSDDAKTAFKRIPILPRCLETKCKEWVKSSDKDWVKELCDRLPEHSEEIWQWLSLWSGLHDYPEKILEYVLSPDQILFVRKIPVDAVLDLPLEPTAREQMLTQIESLFKKIRGQITSSDEFQKVVGWTSGRLFEEYELVSSVLKENRFSPSLGDVRNVQAKFKLCLGVSTTQLNSLVYCVMPIRPSLLGPGEKRTPQEWIRWTTEEYIPYRTWQVHNGFYDEELEQTVTHFSEWYLKEYESIHKDPDLSLINCLNAIASNDSKSDFSIILLLDCLPVTFMHLVEDALLNIGFSRDSLHYCFALLPTITEYNKSALLSGVWENSELNYEAILKVRASTYWGGKSIIYLSNLKALSEMPSPQKGTIAVLNLGDGDELLHSDVESKNTSYEEELHRIYARVAESVNRLSKMWTGLGEQFNIYVVTDHGACRVLEEERRSFDSRVVSKLFPDEKHRFSAVSENHVDDIPKNLWALGYRFKRPFVSEDKIYFLPKGHNTVRQPGKISGYLHGGATPEEVIVPVALYKLEKATWKVPTARFLNLNLVRETGEAKFYIQRVVTVEIELQNPNATDILILGARVLSPETDIKDCETVVVRADDANVLRMNCYFQKSALDQKSLEIEITYEINGQTHALPLTLNSEFKSAVSGGLNLRDL